MNRMTSANAAADSRKPKLDSLFYLLSQSASGSTKSFERSQSEPCKGTKVCLMLAQACLEGGGEEEGIWRGSSSVMLLLCCSLPPPLGKQRLLACASIMTHMANEVMNDCLTCFEINRKGAKTKFRSWCKRWRRHGNKVVT